jgi:hypothetical protein
MTHLLIVVGCFTPALLLAHSCLKAIKSAENLKQFSHIYGQTWKFKHSRNFVINENALISRARNHAKQAPAVVKIQALA